MGNISAKSRGMVAHATAMRDIMVQYYCKCFCLKASAHSVAINTAAPFTALMINRLLLSTFITKGNRAWYTTHLPQVICFLFLFLNHSPHLTLRNDASLSVESIQSPFTNCTSSEHLLTPFMSYTPSQNAG